MGTMWQPLGTRGAGRMQAATFTRRWCSKLPPSGPRGHVQPEAFAADLLAERGINGRALLRRVHANAQVVDCELHLVQESLLRGLGGRGGETVSIATRTATRPQRRDGRTERSLAASSTAAAAFAMACGLVGSIAAQSS